MHKHIFRHGERKKYTAKTTKMKYILMFFIVEMSEKKMLDAPTEQKVRERERGWRSRTQMPSKKN